MSAFRAVFVAADAVVSDFVGGKTCAGPGNAPQRTEEELSERRG